MVKQKRGLFEDIVDLTAKFPWWVGIGLAISAYFVMHQFAMMQNTTPISTKDLGEVMGRSFLKGTAVSLQYILPLLFCMGALSSVFAQRKRNTLYSNVANSGERRSLEEMSWQEFEQLVGEFFRRRGFSVQETGGGDPDGGVDLVLSRGADRYFVQCKRWKARQVGVNIVRELYDVMAAGNAAGGYVVTSGAFTDEAQRFAEGSEIKLIAGNQLVAMIRSAQEGLKPAPQKSHAPTCPQCGSGMILRTARKGTLAGKPFWDCSTYPKCHGTRPA